jgi:ribosomal protein L11 methyltransferase
MENLAILESILPFEFLINQIIKMKYTKTNCTLIPDNELNREILIAELGYMGYDSFNETEELVEAYINSSDFAEEQLSGLAKESLLSFEVKFMSEEMPDQNWNEEWEQNSFQPLLIANRVIIRAPYHTDFPAAEYELIIDPGMAFGTGNHETTTLMIEEILDLDLNQKSVLDMGCGTGILSILSSKRGAKKIIGIDIDTWAVNSTLENAKLNHTTNIETILGGSESIPADSYDVIYANIQRNILIQDMPNYKNVLNPGGELIMSGFYSDDLKAIQERATQIGLEFSRFKELDTWVAAVFTLK